jgi:serine/threonine protein kinase
MSPGVAVVAPGSSTMADTEPLPGDTGGDQQEQDRSGSVVGGKYKVQRLLGAGGMGSVYEARNTWTKRRVAIKFLRPDLSVTRESVLRFMQEAQSAASIAHPNIVDVLDMGRDATDGALYIVQEFLAGQTLRQRLRKTPGGPAGIPVFEAVDIALPVMGALLAAHSRGIVHRDIKPENIFLTTGPGGELVPKLIDFGVSKVHGHGGVAEQTTPGAFVGTPRYMSPEQLKADRNIDGRADVWSIGVVLYEMLTGECPYQGDNMFSLVSSILKGKPLAAHQRVPSVAASFSLVVQRSLEPKLDDRYADMRAFVDAILACPAADDPKASMRLVARHKAALNPVAPVEEHRPAIEEEATAFPTELFTPLASSSSSSNAEVGRAAAALAQGSASTSGSRAVTLDGAPAVRTQSGLSMNGELHAAALAAQAPSSSRRWMVVGGVALVALVAGGLGARSLFPGSTARTAVSPAPVAAPVVDAGAAPAGAKPGAATAPAPRAADGGAAAVAPPLTADGGAPVAAAADAGTGPAAQASPAGPASKKTARPATPAARKGRTKATEQRRIGDSFVMEPD